MQREEIRNIMEAELNKHEQFNKLEDATKKTIVRKLERGCFNNACNTCEKDGIVCRWNVQKFVARYSQVSYKVISNLKCSSLVARIIALTNGSALTLEDVASMSSYELDPSGSQKERAEIELRRQQRVEQKVSKSYTCKKCGHNETTVRAYQARAADEDSSLSIKCLRCLHVWRH